MIDYNARVVAHLDDLYQDPDYVPWIEREEDDDEWEEEEEWDEECETESISD